MLTQTTIKRRKYDEKVFTPDVLDALSAIQGPRYPSTAQQVNESKLHEYDTRSVAKLSEASTLMSLNDIPRFFTGKALEPAKIEMNERSIN